MTTRELSDALLEIAEARRVIQAGEKRLRVAIEARELALGRQAKAEQEFARVIRALNEAPEETRQTLLIHGSLLPLRDRALRLKRFLNGL